MRLHLTLFIAMFAIADVQSQDLFHKYDVELVQRFSNRRGTSNIVSQSIQGYGGSSSANFVYTSDGSLKIYDPLQNRIVVLGKNYEIVQTIAYPETGYISQFGDWYLGFFRLAGFEICNLNGMSVSRIENFPDELKNPKGLLLRGNYLFVSDYSGLVYSYQFEKAYSGQPVLLDPNETRALFQSNSGRAIQAITIDSKGRLFLDSQLITRNYRTFIAYLKEKKGTIENVGLSSTLSANPFKFWPDGMRFLGRDVNGNWYWGDNTGVAIFSDKGDLIEYLVVDWEKLELGTPHVDSNGDLLYLGESEDWVSLYRLKNIWDRTFDVGILNDSSVRVRNGAGVTSEIVAQLDKGMQVAVVGQTQERQYISGKTAPWFQIRLADGREGWIFGAFLDVGGGFGSRKY